MYIEQIKNERLARLIKAARNAGGSLENDVIKALADSPNEEKFIDNWYWALRNEMQRQFSFYNSLAEIAGWEKAELRL